MDLGEVARMTRLSVERIARITHEVNRAYCAAIGDFTQVPWESAPDWQRESAIAGVEAIYSGAALTPADQHDSWAAQKFADGWKYGEVKDARAKTHPCLVPYGMLPPEQKAKDFLFRAVALALR